MIDFWAHPRESFILHSSFQPKWFRVALLQCKVILIGDANVGKTSLIRRFVEGQFNVSYKATIGVDLFYKEIQSSEGLMRMNVWDIAGQTTFSIIRPKFYSGAKGALLVFDLTMPSSFKSLSDWVNDIKNGQKDLPIVLLGNKNDMTRLREISDQMAREFVSETPNIHDYFETSAKTGENVEKAFQLLSSAISRS